MALVFTVCERGQPLQDSRKLARLQQLLMAAMDWSPGEGRVEALQVGGWGWRVVADVLALMLWQLLLPVLWFACCACVAPCIRKHDLTTYGAQHACSRTPHFTYLESP
jgi:hypothetical protein